MKNIENLNPQIIHNPYPKTTKKTKHTDQTTIH